MHHFGASSFLTNDYFACFSLSISTFLSTCRLCRGYQNHSTADNNINPIAVKYGGGGHMKASGATLKNREEAMALLSDLINITEN